MIELTGQQDEVYECFEYIHDHNDGILDIYEAKNKKHVMRLSMYSSINNDTEVTLYDSEVPLEFIKHFEELLRKLESDNK